MNKARRTLELLTVLAGVAGPIWSARASGDFRIQERIVPAGRECEANFFETLKFAHPPERAFDAATAPHWDLSKVAVFIPQQGVSFSDVNHEYGGTVDRQAILAQLDERKGKIFVAFAHIAHIYSIPYKQYSQLRFANTPDGQVVVDMAGWYAITFRDTTSGCEVVKWDYTMLEGE